MVFWLSGDILQTGDGQEIKLAKRLRKNLYQGGGGAGFLQHPWGNGLLRFVIPIREFVFGSRPSTLLKKLQNLTIRRFEKFEGRKLRLTSNKDDDYLHNHQNHHAWPTL